MEAPKEPEAETVIAEILPEEGGIQGEIFEVLDDGDGGSKFVVLEEEDLPQQEFVIHENNDEREPTQSIEINIHIVKSFFHNTISVYEALVLNNCSACEIIKREEFVRLHNNLVELDALVKMFDLSFDKSLLENLIKKAHVKTKTAKILESREQRLSTKIKSTPCYLSSCPQVYASVEGAKMHFLKTHCTMPKCFEPVQNPHPGIDFSKVPLDNSGRYMCDLDAFCMYTTTDRSNFRLHRDRHLHAKRFQCFQCTKCFISKEPLMVHFIRVHMGMVPWHLSHSDIRTVRKSIRKTTVPELVDVDLDDIEDQDEDLTGPELMQNLEISAYISQAINEYTVTVEDTSEKISLEQIENPDETVDVSQEESGSSNKKPKLEQNKEKAEDGGEENEDGEDGSRVEQEAQEHPEEEDIEMSEESKSIKPIKQRTRNYKCIHNFCSQDFYTKKSLLIHLKASHDPNNRFECDVEGCFARYKSPSLLSQHKRRHMCQLKCEHCDYQTHLTAHMERHLAQHSGNGAQHSCPECGEKFIFLGAMSTHRKNAHNILESLQCDAPDCLRVFKSTIGLNKHKREFHMNMKTMYKCVWENCAQEFSSKSACENHQLTHTDMKPHQCEHKGCSKTFRLRETMVRHLRTHDEFPFRCPVSETCDETFTSRRLATIHGKRAHNCEDHEFS